MEICDVTDAAAVEAAVAASAEHFGRIDGVVCNAGSLRDRTFAKMPLEDFRFIVEVHLMGTVNLLKPIWPIMLAQGYGRVVLTTSTSALYGNFGQSNYDAAKLGIVGLCKSLALEGAKSGVTVNCIAPVAYTRLGEGIFPEALRPRLGTAHISRLVCYLLSRSGGDTTSKIIEVGGGKIALAKTMRTDFVSLRTEGDETQTIRALAAIDPTQAPPSAREAFTAHLEAALEG